MLDLARSFKLPRRLDASFPFGKVNGRRLSVAYPVMFSVVKIQYVKIFCDDDYSVVFIVSLFLILNAVSGY
ncbi:hypothetical protein D918_06995 [Trichuris suis]|nr:hypothetical protein D918_06995 [Trichuris suis]